ncbi:MAG: retention module-containing protein [Betaproteobacteria bacterium]|nr:retention module-containing protein [Betaproteobacteria bacterium]
MATSSSKAAGTVTFVAGEVKAVAIDGTPRILQVGDRVFMKEVIATTANAVVQVHLENGRLFELSHDSTTVLDDAVVGSGVPAAPGSTAPQEMPELQAAMAGGAEPGDATTAAADPAVADEASRERTGGEHATVVVEQANTGVPVTSGFTADSVSKESATAEAGKNPLHEEASFLVQEGPLFPHPVVAASGARTADKSAGSVAESRGDLTDAANTAAGPDLTAHGGADSNAPAISDRLALGDLLQGDPSAGDLTAYLSFSYDAQTNSTTVNVHPASGSGGDHQIVLMGVDLTSGGTLTTDAVLQTLLSHGKLHSDT